MVSVVVGKSILGWTNYSPKRWCDIFFISFVGALVRKDTHTTGLNNVCKTSTQFIDFENVGARRDGKSVVGAI